PRGREREPYDAGGRNESRREPAWVRLGVGHVRSSGEVVWTICLAPSSFIAVSRSGLGVSAGMTEVSARMAMPYSPPFHVRRAPSAIMGMASRAYHAGRSVVSA